MARKLPRQLLPLVLIALVALPSGCQLSSKPQWTATNTKNLTLPAPRMSADSVILEISFVHVTPEANRVDAPLWHDINEVPLSWETHKKLLRNGIRCGMIAGPLPDSLGKLIKAEKKYRRCRGVKWQPET